MTHLGGGHVLHQSIPFILIEFVPTRNLEDARANVWRVYRIKRLFEEMWQRKWSVIPPERKWISKETYVMKHLTIYRERCGKVT